MRFTRHLTTHLQAWKTSSFRKPLVIRGARQVGKTTLVKAFAKQYKQFISLNLEKTADRSYFDQLDEVRSITEALFLSRNLNPGLMSDTLVFIDEIQESPKAIQMLRYFYEEVSELHVIAAGSLLEFALQEVKSFPVGRVEFLYLHPLNFGEYLDAQGHSQALEQLRHIPVKPVADNVLYELFHRYAIVGGMPEIVSTDLEKKNLADLPKVYESIWTTYKHDVEKYTGNDTERKIIRHIMDTAPMYLDERIRFQGFGNSTYGSRETGECFRALDSARIIQLIYPTTDIQPPFMPDLKKAPRLQFLDTGLVNYTLGIQADMLGISDLSAAYKGAVIPHLITQELISLQSISEQKPAFWVREKKQSQAEVDLVFTARNLLIPIEIKSGSTGKLKSLHQFIDAADHPYAVRVYGGAFRVEKAKTPAGKPYVLLNLPYYTGTQIPEYIHWFIDNY